jgi:hypothetical protein
MVAHATLPWGSRRRMGTAEDLRSRGASVQTEWGGLTAQATSDKGQATGLEQWKR